MRLSSLLYFFSKLLSNLVIATVLVPVAALAQVRTTREAPIGRANEDEVPTSSDRVSVDETVVDEMKLLSEWTPNLTDDTNSTVQSFKISESLQGNSGMQVEQTKTSSSEYRREKFEQVFKRVIWSELIELMKKENMPPEAVERFLWIIDYIVPGGKLTRGMTVVDSVEILKGRSLTDDEYLKASLLGWLIEMFQACGLVADDMVDKSTTRRGRTCLYRVEGIGITAIRHVSLIKCTIFRVFRKHFRQEPYYVDVLELFQDTSFQTTMGQLVDLITAPEDRVDLGKFSIKKHTFIARYKTTYYSFYLPVALAFHFCGMPESYKVDGHTVRPYDAALTIMLPLGEYYQAQDDFLDYAGTPEQIGKVGTDIVDNKCSWCINVALEVATQEQRMVLDANYGRKDAEMEARVKKVYEEIRLRERYRVYEEATKEHLDGLIARIPEPEGNVEERVVLRREVFTAYLNKIYKRVK